MLPRTWYNQEWRRPRRRASWSCPFCAWDMPVPVFLGAGRSFPFPLAEGALDSDSDSSSSALSSIGDGCRLLELALAVARTSRPAIVLVSHDEPGIRWVLTPSPLYASLHLHHFLPRSLPSLREAAMPFQALALSACCTGPFCADVGLAMGLAGVAGILSAHVHQWHGNLAPVLAGGATDPLVPGSASPLPCRQSGKSQYHNTHLAHG